ncbi:MAG: hypothetical protein U0R49_00120 [Fimbriimonadales bacterium]
MEFYAIKKYVLSGPTVPIYNQAPEGGYDAPLGEFLESVEYEDDGIPNCSVCNRGLFTNVRVPPLKMNIPKKHGDFLGSQTSELIVSDKVLNMLNKIGATGFEPRPIVVCKVGRMPTVGKAPKYWELRITGKGGVPDPACGVVPHEICPACGITRYTSYQRGILVDKNEWDGSDFFIMDPWYHIFITERVKNLIVENQLRPCVLYAASEMVWPDSYLPEDYPPRWPLPEKYRQN